MKQPPATRTMLRPGQSMHFHAKHGQIVVAAKGAIRLAICLHAEQSMRQTIDLCEGEAHVVQESGWLAILTQHPAEVVRIAKETRLEALWRYYLGIAAEGHRRWRSLVA